MSNVKSSARDAITIVWVHSEMSSRGNVSGDVCGHVPALCHQGRYHSRFVQEYDVELKSCVV